MPSGGKLKQFLFSRINIGRTLRDSFDFVVGVIGYDNSGNAERRKVRHAVNSLVRSMLFKDGRITPARRDICRRLLEEHFDHAFVEERLQELVTMTPLGFEEAVDVLAILSPEQQKQIVEFLQALAVELGDDQQDIKIVLDAAERLGMSIPNVRQHCQKLRDEYHKRKVLVGSGWGVLVAIGVILLFVITAKLLQSVIFGLIISAILLPMEKFIEGQLRRKSGLFYYGGNFISLFFAPLRKLSAILTRRDSSSELDPERVRERRLIRQSVVITAVTSMILLTALGIGIFGFARGYMREWRQSLRQTTILSGDTLKYTERINARLDNWKNRFEELPAIRAALDFVSRTINDPETRVQLSGELLKRSGGMWEITADIFGVVTSFFANLLLTVFFALLFLFKMAEFCRNDDSDKSKSEYVIRTIFNGIWLPGANEGVISEARRIIEGVFFRLRVWLKGYLTLVLVDSTVYTTVFFFMGLPFFWVLGIIAGCGILLPYLGPVISCAITLLVSMAFGGVSGGHLLGIIIAYLIYNGIIEQFILYPAVIGEALGLSTLETIIVVLLGAIFAGITGMIFALPAASVAKYIIPQLYRNFLNSKLPGTAGQGGEAV